MSCQFHVNVYINCQDMLLLCNLVCDVLCDMHCQAFLLYSLFLVAYTPETETLGLFALKNLGVALVGYCRVLQVLVMYM